MTDKQIIIDGCDVSGCEYIIPPHKQCPNKPMPYAKETSCFACKEHNTKLNFCKNNPNCYYKQLKRAEQRIVELNKTIKAKEQECEELKRQRQGDKGLITSTGKMNYELLQEYDKLKTALTEIKEIAEKGHKEKGNLMRTWWFKDILQKISKCEVE